MKNIIPERIKMARRLCRFSMDELVRRMGDGAVSKMAISKIERGLMRPSDTTLQAIADACRQPISFFFRPLLNLGAVDYRFKNEVTLAQRQAIKAKADEQLQHYFEMQAIEGECIPFAHPLPRTVLRNYADAEAAAVKLRRKWEIGLQPIHSVYELQAIYGIHVLEVDLECTNVDGLSTFVHGSFSSKDDIPVIIINTRTHTTTERKRFTSLHELCHLLCTLRPDDEARHQAYVEALPAIPHTVTLKQPNEERLCDLFASAMLMPQPCVLRRFGKARTAVTLDEFKATRRLYGNSVASQIHRLHDLRIIDDTLYHHLYETVITPDRKEEHLGEPYPIMETADRMPMLEERLKVEMKQLKDLD